MREDVMSFGLVLFLRGVALIDTRTLQRALRQNGRQ